MGGQLEAEKGKKKKKEKRNYLITKIIFFRFNKLTKHLNHIFVMDLNIITKIMDANQVSVNQLMEAHQVSVNK